MPHDAIGPPPSSGEPLNMPASLMRRLMELARKEDAGGAAPLLKKTGAIVNRVWNTSFTTTIEPLEAIHSTNTWRSWESKAPTEWARNPVLYGSTPQYQHWSVALEPIKPRQHGLAVVAGAAIAKITPRGPDPVSTYHHVDVHPTPTGGTREHLRLAIRYHGLARLLALTSGHHADYELGLIFIGDRTTSIPVVAKNTAVNSGEAIEVYAMRPKMGSLAASVDTDDSFRAYLPSVGLHKSHASIGYDDDPDEATIGQAYCYGAARQWYILRWPTTFPIQLQDTADQSNWTSPAPTWRFCKPNYLGGWTPIGSTFTGIPWGPQRQTITAELAAKTINAGTGHITQLTYETGTPFIDPTGAIDAPYGTIRAVHSTGYTGTGPYRGWYWCDGSSHPSAPDLRDRFIVGHGPSHAFGATGGHATHGNGTNDHHAHDHESTTHLIADHATTHVDDNADGVQFKVVATKTHNCTPGALPWDHGAGSDGTDNEPPWYALAFAIRLAP